MKPWWHFDLVDIVSTVIALCLMIWLVGNDWSLVDWLVLPAGIMTGRFAYYLLFRRRRERDERRSE